MGNMLMILIFGMILAFSNFAGNMNVRMLTMTDNSVGYYERVQSRNIGHSIIELGKNQLVISPQWRVGYYDFPLDGGIAELTVKDSVVDGLSVVVLYGRGTFGSETVDMRAIYKQKLILIALDEFSMDGNKDVFKDPDGNVVKLPAGTYEAMTGTESLDLISFWE